MKGFTKLSIQIAVLSISMIALSFLTDTDIWLEYFNSTHLVNDIAGVHCPDGWHYNNHNHWNYRGYVYIYTGFTFFVMSVVKIIMSHNENDFK